MYVKLTRDTSDDVRLIHSVLSVMTSEYLVIYLLDLDIQGYAKLTLKFEFCTIYTVKCY